MEVVTQSLDLVFDHLLPGVVVLSVWFLLRQRVKLRPVFGFVGLHDFDRTFFFVLFGVIVGPLLPIPNWLGILGLAILLAAMSFFIRGRRGSPILLVLFALGILATVLGGKYLLRAFPSSVWGPVALLSCAVLTTLLGAAAIWELLRKD